MTNKIKINATGDGACLFNSLSISLFAQILNGDLDHLKDTDGYKELLQRFQRHHPDKKIENWDDFKNVLSVYKHPQDIEKMLSPVLFWWHVETVDLGANIDQEITNIVNIEVVKNNGARTMYENGAGDLVLSYSPNIATIAGQDKLALKEEIAQKFSNIEQGTERYDILMLVRKEKDLLQKAIDLVKNSEYYYTRSFGSNEIGVVVKALSLNIHDNAIIRGAHWDAMVDEELVNKFIDTTAEQQLGHLGSHDIFKKIEDPISEKNIEIKTESVESVEINVDDVGSKITQNNPIQTAEVEFVGNFLDNYNNNKGTLYNTKEAPVKDFMGEFNADFSKHNALNKYKTLFSSYATYREKITNSKGRMKTHSNFFKLGVSGSDKISAAKAVSEAIDKILTDGGDTIEIDARHERALNDSKLGSICERFRGALKAENITLQFQEKLDANISMAQSNRLC